MARKWKREEVVRLLEMLIERSAPVVTHNEFRKHLTRNQNLYTNQIIREANGNIAYRSVDIDVDSLSDEDFWDVIDSTPYADLVEDNAAIAILKMAEKFNLIN
jgi:hypothetical protein